MLNRNAGLLVGVIALWIVFSAYGDELTARRYGSLIDDELVSMLYLLSANEVQKNLQLSTQQVHELYAAFSTPAESMHSAEEGCERAHTSLAQGALPEAEVVQIHAESRTRSSACLRASISNQMYRILTAPQLSRLQELFLQMRGPAILLTRSELAQACGVSPTMRSAMQRAVASYDSLLRGLTSRRAELEMNAVRPCRDESDIAGEIACIDSLIVEVEKDKDHILLNLMGPEQRQAWSAMLGDPLPIDWGPESLLEIPEILSARESQ